MDNIVGKVLMFIACVSLGLSLEAAPVELRIKSMQGVPLERVGLGVPFLLEVTSEGTSSSDKPQIAGLENFQVQTAGVSILINNGKQSATYTYKVRIDQVGTYLIGPATLYHAGKQIQSKALRVVVDQAQRVEAAATSAASEPDVRINIAVDKKEVYIGERVTCTITFLGKKDKVKLEHIEVPVLPDTRQGVQDGPVIGSQTIDGVEYASGTWTWQFFPQKDGSFVIPAVSADYQVEQEMRDNLSFFSPFFRFRTERKRAYSNAVSLDVLPLPADQGPIQAVGLYTSFTASIKPDVAQEGEGMVLTLEIEGDGDLAGIESIKLAHMPDALKWYDSKQYVRDTRGAHGLPVKCFEYIVQGLKPGSWQIPEQQFSFFDVSKRKYMTLETVACPVTIQAVASTSKTKTVDKQSVVKQDQQKNDLLPLNMHGSWRLVQHRRALPWPLFFLLWCLPLVWLVIKSVRLLISSRADYFKQHFAYKHARAKIIDAEKMNSYADVHRIFIELFADRLRCAPALIGQDIIDQKLRAAGLTEVDLADWNDFYMHMYEYAFGLSRSSLNRELFFKQALEWITRLEKLL